jgi:putative ABC transport system permease protein
MLILAGFAARYLLRARLRFLVTLAGITMAVFLICFQLSLLIGFRRAAARMITAADAQAWIMPIGVPCFEFGASLAERHRDTAAGVTGVTGISAIATGFATFVREDGERRAVLVVGGDRDVGGTFPAVDGIDPFPNQQQAWIPESNAEVLGVRGPGARVEIGGQSIVVSRLLAGYGSFLGSPYVFTTFRDARRILGLSVAQASFLAVRIDAASDVDRAIRQLQDRLPNATVLPTAVFADRAIGFWLTQTGAGGAILVAAILGFLVGLAVVAQTVYAATLENFDDFVTLRALGASSLALVSAIEIQSLGLGLVGGLLGIAIADPVIAATKSSLVPWIDTPWWLRFFSFGCGLVICGLASLAAVRRIFTIEPADVFRG